MIPVTPRKLIWQWKIHHLKMYFLLQMVISNVMLVFRCVFTRKHLRKETMGKTWLSCDKPVGVSFYVFYLKADFLVQIGKERYPKQKGWHPKRCFRASHTFPPSAMERTASSREGSKSLFERQQQMGGGGESCFFRAKDHQGAWTNSTHLKNISQMGSFAQSRDENHKYLMKPSGKRSHSWLENGPIFFNRVNTSTHSKGPAIPASYDVSWSEG